MNAHLVAAEGHGSGSRAALCLPELIHWGNTMAHLDAPLHAAQITGHNGQLRMPHFVPKLGTSWVLSLRDLLIFRLSQGTEGRI